MKRAWRKLMRSGKLVTKTQASMHTFISVTNFWLIWQRRTPAFQYRCTKKFLISRATPPKGTKERGQGAHGGAAAGSGQCGRPGRAGIATQCRPYTGTQTPLRCRPGPRADLSRGASCRFRDGQRAHVNNQPCIVELCDGANVRDDFVKSIAHRIVTQCSARGDRLRGWACRTRTGESVRELSDWNPVTTSPEVGQAWRRRLSRASCVKRICSSGRDFGRRSLARKSELSRGSIGPTPSCTRLLS